MIYFDCLQYVDCYLNLDIDQNSFQNHKIDIMMCSLPPLSFPILIPQYFDSLSSQINDSIINHNFSVCRSSHFDNYYNIIENLLLYHLLNFFQYFDFQYLYQIFLIFRLYLNNLIQFERYVLKLY